ncbi:TPA: hypothetical protein VBM32_002095, partial [Streptococcus agalactiae]|nr:hypothetical protein [Streptococcus agalactiae]
MKSTAKFKVAFVGLVSATVLGLQSAPVFADDAAATADTPVVTAPADNTGAT